MWLLKLFEPLEFRDPVYLFSCLLAPLIIALAFAPSGRVIFSSLRLLPARGSSFRTRLLWLPPALLAAASILLGIALAGPRLPDRSQRIEREGIAIMMAVDISSSMKALDLSEGDKERTRLEAVMSVFKDFVLGGEDEKGRPDDAIGIVSFAGFADTRCPLTLDHDILVEIADTLQIVDSRREDGTAVGDGLGLAVERLRASEAKSRVVILLTDGVNNRGEETPLAAAELAHTLGIKVYTIGAGTQGLAPVRMMDPFSGREVLQQVEVEIDEESLQAIAERTGGRYFRATDASALRQVYREIDGLERTKIGEERYREFTEYYDYFAGAGLLLAALAWLLTATVLRRLV